MKPAGYNETAAIDFQIMLGTLQQGAAGVSLSINNVTVQSMKT